MQLRTFLMGNALFGARPLELCAVRECDIDWNTGEITFRAEYSKMRVARKRKMNAEFKAALLAWRQKKYKPHRTTLAGRKQIWVKPEPRRDDLLFAVWKRAGIETKPESLYEVLLRHFHELLSHIGAETWRSDGARREVTFYTIGREFVRTHIANTLGNSDWAEFWMGHEHSSYYSMAQKEVDRLSALTGQALTFLDLTAIDSSQKALDARIVEVQNQANEKIEFLMAKISALERAYQTRTMYEKHLEASIPLPPAPTTGRARKG